MRWIRTLFENGRLTAPPRAGAVERLAEGLLQNFRNGRSIVFVQADVKYWVMAVDRLLDVGEFAAAGSAVALLAPVFKKTQYFTSVAVMLEVLPPPTGDAAFDAFVDDRALDIQIVRRCGARATLLAFCAGDRLTLPLGVMHRWIGQLQVNVVYVRDRNVRMYLEGIQSVGPGLPATLAHLRSVLGGLGSHQLICYGGSKGGYGCLLYALLLGADAALALGAPTNVDTRTHQRAGFGATRVIDLREAYVGAINPPRAHLVFAGQVAADRAQAVHMQGLPTVSIEAVPDAFEHSVAKDLVRAGRLAPLLQGLSDATARARTWSDPVGIDVNAIVPGAGRLGCAPALKKWRA